jgi:hypothetical protein
VREGRPIRRALVATALVAGVVAALAVGVAARSADSTKIVRWNRIGDAGLNTSRTAVVAHYGPFSGSLAVKKAPEGGEIDITVVRSRVVNISEDSPRYSTPDGIKVGIKTPNTKTWKGFTFNSNFQSWELPFCYGGVNGRVNLDTENRIIRRIMIGFYSGVCPGLKPKQPLTAADKAAITAVIKKVSKPATVKASNYKVAIDSKEWASALITGKDPQGFPIQPAVAVFHHGSTWTLVDVGTDAVGCEQVPIKPLTQIGSDCPG